MYHFMLMSANEWMMLMLMQYKCKNASLTLECYNIHKYLF